MKTCKTCKVRKPREAFYNHPTMKDRKLPNCNVCHNAETRKYQLMRKYGLTVEQWYEIWNAQGQQCKVCGRTTNEETPHQNAREFCVDHTHNSEPFIVRGILCINCNLALGHAKDNPEILRKMADYLETGEPTDITSA